MILTYVADEIYKQSNIHGLDGPMRGNREASPIVVRKMRRAGK